MEKFTTLTGVAAPLPIINVDTDMLIPKQFLKTIKRTGLGKHLFDEMRYTPDGQERPDFVLNQPAYRQAKILVAGDNFGCGSSREGAVYALADAGIRALLAPSFGDIFFNNALKNGIVPVRLPVPVCEALADRLVADPQATVTVDLEAAQVILPGDLGAHPITIDAFARDCLLQGLDEIEMTFTYMDRITAFEAERMARNPWLGR